MIDIGIGEDVKSAYLLIVSAAFAITLVVLLITKLILRKSNLSSLATFLIYAIELIACVVIFLWATWPLTAWYLGV